MPGYAALVCLLDEKAIIGYATQAEDGLLYITDNGEKQLPRVTSAQHLKGII